ncbi:MAG TPA: TlpA disulfide reductase family protein [Microthrixaceae bacterium]|nr:TlpA disulfide reductase family protein [Microthrixaceae bacterium]
MSSSAPTQPVGAARPSGSGRRRTTLAIAVAVGAVGALLVVLLATSPQGERSTESPLVGGLAPDIQASDTTGEEFRIDDYRGQWVLVNFFATWCGPCKVEHPELVAFSEQHARTGDASVVSVAFNEQPSVVKEWFEENGGDWPVIAKGNGGFALEYGVVKLPESFLVAPDGTVVHRFEGGVTAQGVDSVIEALSSQAGDS